MDVLYVVYTSIWGCVMIYWGVDEDASLTPLSTMASSATPRQLLHHLHRPHEPPLLALTSTAEMAVLTPSLLHYELPPLIDILLAQYITS